MSSPVFHRFGPYGPVCGTRDGVNAADVEPPEVTCKRCFKVPVEWWQKEKVAVRHGRRYLVCAP